MGALSSSGLAYINHYAPLHYLPWIARDRALLSKTELRKRGFGDSHFRSTSWKQDSSRGFKDYAFLTIDTYPRILNAKLNAGFPHVAISVPAAEVEKTEYSLCRYNIARTRVLKKGNLPGRPEGNGNGRYYNTQQVPVANSDEDRIALLDKHLGVNMIEVLVPGKLWLNHNSRILVYSKKDYKIAKNILLRCKRDWGVELVEPSGPYNRRDDYGASIIEFVNRCLEDPNWKGNGLDFDRV